MDKIIGLLFGGVGLNERVFGKCWLKVLWFWIVVIIVYFGKGFLFYFIGKFSDRGSSRFVIEWVVYGFYGGI